MFDMVATFGLTHILLTVKDTERSAAFYKAVFGLEIYGRENGRLHATTPGCKDVVTFEAGDQAGKPGGVAHFGFRLVSPNDIDQAVTTALKAGGALLRRGEFAPGFPYAYISDPDGYEVEIWFE